MHAFKHMMGLVVHPAAFSFESAAIHHSSPEGRERPAGGGIIVAARQTAAVTFLASRRISTFGSVTALLFVLEILIRKYLYG
jgi:hypothetical protein